MNISAKNCLSIACFAIIGVAAHSQTKTQYNLAQLFNEHKLTAVNRDVSVDAGKNAIIQKEDFDEGIVWLNGVAFTMGTVEVDIKGQDVNQHSFVGIAFHGANDSTFESIYFRPFNFRTTDSARLSHGVQYISLPAYPWQRLRKEQSGLYESIISPVPDPDNWFHAKFVITATEALVYVNNAATPCLKVSLLSVPNKGMIGVYTADRSGGTFANLTIQND